MTPLAICLVVFVGALCAVILFSLIGFTILAIIAGVFLGLLAVGGILYLLHRNRVSINQWWQARKATQVQRAQNRQGRRVAEQAQRDSRKAVQEAQRERRRLDLEAQRARDLEIRRGVIEVEAITSPEPVYRW